MPSGARMHLRPLFAPTPLRLASADYPVHAEHRDLVLGDIAGASGGGRGVRSPF